MLERTQRICGSLGEYAEQMWFGLSALIASDIGRVVGIKPPTQMKGA